MLPRVSTRFLFPLFRLNFFYFIFFLFNLSFCWFRPVTIAVRATFASCLLSSSPLESPKRVDLPAKNFPKSGPVLHWDRTRGTRSGCPKIARSRVIPAGSSRWRTRSHVSYALRVGSCMYVHTNIHTYIHICIFLYIDIYSAICFFLVLVQRKRESLSLFLSFERKILRFRKMERSRPFRANFEIPRKFTISKTFYSCVFIRP